MSALAGYRRLARLGEDHAFVTQSSQLVLLPKVYPITRDMRLVKTSGCFDNVKIPELVYQVGITWIWILASA